MLRLLGLSSMLVLLAFYTLLFYAMIAALPQATAQSGQMLAWSAGMAVAVVLGSAVLNPWLLDRLMKVQWIQVDQAGDVGPYLQALSSRHGIPLPRLGVAVDPNPYAMTYGLTRGGARLVVTSGLLERLDVDEQCAVVAHEAGHLVSGDFSFATFLATPVVMLTLVSDFFTGTRRVDSPAPAGTGMFISPLASVLVAIYGWMLRPLGRARERWADAFAIGEGQSRIEDARFRMVAGLGEAPAAGTAVNKSFAMAARGFSPVDAGGAGRWTTLAAASSGVLSDEALRRTLAQARSNPYVSDTSLGDGRKGGPTGAQAEPGMLATIAVAGVGPGDEERALERLRSQRMLALLPLVCFLAGIALSYALRGWFGLPLVLWGVGRMVWLLRSHVMAREPLRDLAELLAELPTSWGRSFRVTLSGRVVGHGIPGQTWSPDLVLETDGGWLPLRPRHPLGVFQHFASGGHLADAVGQAVTVSGWLRVREVPFVEAHQVKVGDQTLFYSGFVPLHVVGSLLLIVVGTLLIAAQFAP